MIDDDILVEKIVSIGILQENLRTFTIQANKIKNALVSIKLVDGELPNDPSLGIRMTQEWRQAVMMIVCKGRPAFNKYLHTRLVNSKINSLFKEITVLK